MRRPVSVAPTYLCIRGAKPFMEMSAFVAYGDASGNVGYYNGLNAAARIRL
jgi:hypothetical protein